MCNVSGERVKTFTIGFTAQDMDEAPYARRIAEALGTEHCEQYVSPDGLEKALVETASIYDEPFADSSAIPTKVLSAMTRQHVTVALSGDGGDELFHGYSRYRSAEMYHHAFAWPKSLRRVAARLIRAMPGYRPKAWAYVLESADAAELYSRVLANRQQDLVASSGNGLVGDETAREVYCRLGAKRWSKVPPATDLLSYLPEDLLTKVDRASMAVALEVRVPLLDHLVVEFCARVPRSLKIRDGKTKYLMRRVLGKYVPSELFERPKRGFGMPIAQWFRKELRPWVENELQSNWDWTVDVISRKRIEQLMVEHMNGRANHAPVIWACITWKRWAERVGVI
jgi:asparagine synthase (glutamine-hydrolysing)